MTFAAPVAPRRWRARVVKTLIVAMLVSSERAAFAQIDPLLYLKTQTPEIMLIVDTTSRMQRDADDTYDDPSRYAKGGATREPTIGVTAATTSTHYYRKFSVTNTLCAPFNFTAYAFNCGGQAAYDTSGDGLVTTADSAKFFAPTNHVRGTGPFIVDGHLALGVGSGLELFGDSQSFNTNVGQAGVRMLSWREVR